MIFRTDLVHDMSADKKVSDNLCGSSLVAGPYRNDDGVEPADAGYLKLLPSVSY